MSRKLTVLQVLPALESGGVEVGTLALVEALVRAGHQALVASAGGEMVSALEASGGRHIELPLKTKNPVRIFYNIKKLRQIIAAYKIDIVHARSRAPAWSAFFACKKAGCVFLTTVHGAYNAQSTLKKLYNSVMLRGDRIIAVSEFIKHYLQNTYSQALSKRIQVIARGIDCKVFDPQAVPQRRVEALAFKWRICKHTPLIIMPARLSPSKGHMILLEALASLKDENFLCLFIGSDQGRSCYTASLIKYTAHLHLQDKVRIVEQCNDMPCAYKLADIVLCPSTVPEAFGRVIIEAQAMGKPVIASQLGAPLDLITHGKTGWLVLAGDAQSLALTLKSVLHLDESTKKTLAFKARHQVEQHYSKHVMCQKTLALYQEIIERKDA